MEIIYKSIRTINYETQQISAIDTPSAFDDYVAELINHISNNNSVREYKTRSNSTEVIGNILGVCANINDDDGSHACLIYLILLQILFVLKYILIQKHDIGMMVF